MKKYLIICILIAMIITSLRFGIFQRVYSKAAKRFTESVELFHIVLENRGNIGNNVSTIELQPLIAHAGGGIDGQRILNSLEALDASYNIGFRFFELDFEWTSDNELVLLHDWRKSIPRLFNMPAQRYSLEEYKKLEMVNGMTKLSLDTLVSWMRQHPDAFIVTDVKGNNIGALLEIKTTYPDMQKNFIPQIYYFREYFIAKDLEYKNIILTLYVAEYSNAAVLKFASKYFLAAVTMPVSRALTSLPQDLKKINVLTYAHTVNDVALQQKLKKKGIFGVYTDFLHP